jgi:hypothetical protein
LVVCFAAKITVAVWGATGIGKSAVIKQTIADLGRQLFDFRLSVAEPTDLGGTPVPVFPPEAPAYLQYLMANDLMPFKTAIRENLKSALFFDEYDRTDNPNTRNASLQLIYDGSVNGHELVDDCVIVIAGNATYDDDTSTMSNAQAGRMVHLYMETESVNAMESFLSYAEGDEDRDGLSDVTRGFAREKWALLQGDKTRTMTAELAKPTPRTLEFADRIMGICESPETPFPTKDISEALVQGCIGRAAATEFFAFRKLYLSAPTTAEILADPERVRIPTKVENGQEIPDPGILYSLTLSLCDQATKDDAVAKAVATYGLRWPEEPAAYLFRRLLDKYPQIATSEAFRKWNNKRLHTQPSSGQSWPNRLPELVKIYLHSKPLPENDQWVNRVQIPSESDPSRTYIVSQNRKSGTWACSCRAWATRQTCKHVTKIPAEFSPVGVK